MADKDKVSDKSKLSRRAWAFLLALVVGLALLDLALLVVFGFGVYFYDCHGAFGGGDC